MTLHLGSATIALLGPHVMVEQQAAGIPAEMAEIYDLLQHKWGILTIDHNACEYTRHSLQIQQRPRRNLQSTEYGARDQ